VSNLQLCEQLTALPGDLTEPQTQDPDKAFEEQNSRRRKAIYNQETNAIFFYMKLAVEKLLYDLTDIILEDLLSKIEKK